MQVTRLAFEGKSIKVCELTPSVKPRAHPLILGAYVQARNGAYDLFTLVGLSKWADTPAGKRKMQLAVKQADFARQQMTRGVIDTSPLKNMVYEHKGSKQYIIEQPRVAADGTPISSGRIINAADYSQAAKGIARLDENGKVTYQACFAAGTLVHTDQGPLPIEKVRVGTKVLSQPENGGEIAYKRVVNTVAHLDQQVHAVQVKVQGSDELTTLITTPNHPFWVQTPLAHGQHWLAAEHLEPGMVLQIAGGGAGDNSVPRLATVYANGLIRHTQHAHIGFAADDRVGVGMVLDLTDPKHVHLVNPEQASERGSLQLGKPFITPVYNFEVEDFHTYYVGDSAVWVHNTNCPVDAPVDFVLRQVERDGPKPTCFSGGTLVIMEGGLCAEISLLSVGTKVLSRCEKTGEQTYKRITKKFEHSLDEWGEVKVPTYLIDIAIPGGAKEILRSTAEHPFWVNDIGWVPAIELQPGQKLEICDPIGTDDCDRPLGQKTEDVILSGQRWQAEVVSVSRSVGACTVYNIEVEDFHTYFVGPFGVWVHNTKEVGKPVYSQELKLSDATAQPKGQIFRPNPDDFKNPAEKNGAIGELEAADILAKYDNLQIVHLPDKGSNKLGITTGRPDILIDGRTADIYTPSSGNLSTINGKLVQKTTNQSSDIVLNLNQLHAGPRVRPCLLPPRPGEPGLTPPH
ncbi:MAG: hypothetical protein RIS44_2694 [Pseudomonadota bacterium]|jgi:hypothetical protein